MPRIDRVKRATQAVRETMWDVNTDVLSFGRKIGIITLRVLTILRVDYGRNMLGLKAAALTNITLMSVVPVLAFVVALAKGLGVYARLIGPVEATLHDPNSELPSGVAEVLVKLLEFIQGTDISALGPIAVLITLWTIISVIGSIETSFNTIWGIQEGRDLMTRFKDYLLLVFLLPIAFGVTTSLAAAMKVERVQELLYEYLGGAGLAISMFVSLAVSVLLMALALTYMYRFLPNTRVQFKPAFIGAVVTTIVWLIVQRLYVKFQIGVASANSIYGAFATLPLFLSWLYISWLITLLGAELVFALQCHKDYDLADPHREPPPGVVRDAAVALFGDLAENFRRGGRWRLPDALARLNLSNRVARRALHVLRRAGLVVPTAELDVYLPAENTNRITLEDLSRAFERERLDPATLPAGQAQALLQAFQAEQAKLDERLKAAPITSA